MIRVRGLVNQLYYNLFRFERYTQYLVSIPLYRLARLTGLGGLIKERSGERNWETYFLNILNDPRGGISLTYAGIHISVLLTLILLTLLNLLGVIFGLSLHTFWFYGMIAAVICSVALSYYVAPADDREYIADFRRLESMPKSTKRLAAFLTFLFVVGVWVTFVLSFVFYIRTLLVVIQTTPGRTI